MARFSFLWCKLGAAPGYSGTPHWDALGQCPTFSAPNSLLVPFAARVAHPPHHHHLSHPKRSPQMCQTVPLVRCPGAARCTGCAARAGPALGSVPAPSVQPCRAPGWGWAAVPYRPQCPHPHSLPAMGGNIPSSLGALPALCPTLTTDMPMSQPPAHGAPGAVGLLSSALGTCLNTAYKQRHLFGTPSSPKADRASLPRGSSTPLA